ncbi:MAG: hypothetical protein Q9183_004894 [Haloplaca sp. 2 TL-2023]
MAEEEQVEQARQRQKEAEPSDDVTDQTDVGDHRRQNEWRVDTELPGCDERTARIFSPENVQTEPCSLSGFWGTPDDRGISQLGGLRILHGEPTNRLPDWLLTRQWSVDPDDIEKCDPFPEWVKRDHVIQQIIAGDPRFNPTPPKTAMKPAFPEPSKLQKFNRFHKAWKAKTAAKRLRRARRMNYTIAQYDDWVRLEVERVEAEERTRRQQWNENTPTTEGTLPSSQTEVEGNSGRIAFQRTHTREEEQPARDTDPGPSTSTSIVADAPGPQTFGMPEQSVSEGPKKRKRNTGNQKEPIGKHDRAVPSLSQISGTNAGESNPAKIRKVSHVDTSLSSARPKMVEDAETPGAQQSRKRKRDLDTKEMSDSKRMRREVAQQGSLPDRGTRRLNRERVKAQAEQKGLRASISQVGRVSVTDPTLDVIASSPLLQQPGEPPKHADKTGELTAKGATESSGTNVANANEHSLQRQHGPVKKGTGARTKEGRQVLNDTFPERAKPIQGRRGRRAPVRRQEYAHRQNAPIASPQQSRDRRRGERTKGGRVTKNGREGSETAANAMTKGTRGSSVKRSMNRHKKLAEAVSPALEALMDEPRRTRSQPGTSFAALDTKGQTVMALERQSQRLRERP